MNKVKEAGMRFFSRGEANWKNLQDLPNSSFVCGYCNVYVSSVKGYALRSYSDSSGPQIGAIYICPNCGSPVFMSPNGDQYPSPPFGRPVESVPDDLNKIYEEARRCTKENCYTASVMLCRKILMNIAVNKGAEVGLSFVEYINFLAEKGFMPPDGKPWVDHIRKKGNDASHKIELMDKNDAEMLIRFVEMLLRFIYEFPSMVPKEEGQ